MTSKKHDEESDAILQAQIVVKMYDKTTRAIEDFEAMWFADSISRDYDLGEREKEFAKWWFCAGWMYHSLENEKRNPPCNSAQDAV